MKYVSIENIKKSGLLYAAVGTALVVALIRVVGSVSLFRDSANVYCFMARELAWGNYREAFHPAIPSLNVLLSRLFTFIGISPEQATAIVSSSFYVLSVVFLYYLLKEFVPEKIAGFGALLYACAPKVIKFFVSSLIDSGKCFFLIAALYFFYRLIRSRFRSPVYALWTGGMLGGLALARSEAIGVSGLLFCCIAVYCLQEMIRQKKLYPFFSVLAAFFVFSVLVASRCVVNYFACGKLIFDYRIALGLEKIAAKFTGAELNNMPIDFVSTTWSHLLNQNLRGGYEVYLCFAFVGLLLFVLAAAGKNKARIYPEQNIPEWIKWNNFYFVFIAIILSNMVFFKLSGIAAYRYFLLNIPLLMIFTLAGICCFWHWFKKYVPGKLLLCVAGAALAMQIFNGLEGAFDDLSRQKYATGKYIGELLKQEKDKSRIWFDGNAAVEWYYSGIKRAVPIECRRPDIEKFNDFEYVLWGSEDKFCQTLSSRKDLQEIPLLPGSRVRLFKRK